MGGHVFVTMSDLTRVACDAWLLPVDGIGHVTGAWRRRVPDEVRFDDRWCLRDLPDPWPRSAVAEVHHWYRERRVDGHGVERHNQAWAANIGSFDADIGRYLEGTRRFVTEAARATAPAFGRDRPLLAVPLVGTGAGGGARRAGEIARALLDVIAATLEAGAHADVVVVLDREDAYSAVQALRKHPGHDAWPELKAPERAQGDALADEARAGALVLFLGAGVGMAAGLPSLHTLLADLARAAGLDPGSLLSPSSGLTPSDQARIIQTKLPPGELAERIATLIPAGEHSLLHALLADLPVTETVTTNYDSRFEQAVSAPPAAERRLVVLPYETLTETGRWLLKLHGSIPGPDTGPPVDLVLTRDDYFRHARERAALGGILQALLLTRTLLFVGFSLADDDFHEIAFDVRSVMPESREFGSVCLVANQPYLKALWGNELEFIDFSEDGAETNVISAAACRRLEIFLDYVAAMAATPVRHLFNPALDGVLTDEERAIRDLLSRFVGQSTPAMRASPTWEPIAALLRRYGRSDA